MAKMRQVTTVRELSSGNEFHIPWAGHTLGQTMYLQAQGNQGIVEITSGPREESVEQAVMNRMIGNERVTMARLLVNDRTEFTWNGYVPQILGHELFITYQGTYPEACNTITVTYQEEIE